MIPKFSYLMLATALITIIIGAPSDVYARGKKTKNTLRCAMLAPKRSVVDRYFKMIDRDIRKASNNKWSLRVYASGIAGDEKDIIRKMRVGQMDSAIITTTGLSQVVREVAILNTPGIVRGFNDVKKIQKEMWNEWQAKFLKNDVVLLGWFPAGEYRIFSKGPIKSISDLKGRRPWLWPESFVLKELWRSIGATGVPLGVPDVYGALQTGMIDTFISTPIATVSMQWHTKVDHMTPAESGTLLFAWVVIKPSWDKLPKEVKDVVNSKVKEMEKSSFRNTKKEDAAAFKKLLKRGFKESRSPKGLKKIEAEVRKRLTGRVFSKALADRLSKITGRKD